MFVIIPNVYDNGSCDTYKVYLESYDACSIYIYIYICQMDIIIYRYLWQKAHRNRWDDVKHHEKSP